MSARLGWYISSRFVRNVPCLDCTPRRLYANQPVVDDTHQLSSSRAFHLEVVHPEGCTISLSGMSLGCLIIWVVASGWSYSMFSCMALYI